LVSTPILARLDLCKALILDVDEFTKGIIVILFEKDGRRECVIAYTNKGLSTIQ
jgi:hypothetical protein